jgi:hypothetical protein
MIATTRHLAKNDVSAEVSGHLAVECFQALGVAAAGHRHITGRRCVKASGQAGRRSLCTKTSVTERRRITALFNDVAGSTLPLTGREIAVSPRCSR